jgi:hypothetical protein
VTSAKCGITDDHFLIHFTWVDRVEIAFYDLETINSPVKLASTIPLEPKYGHAFSFADGQVSQWSRVDTVWDDRICTSTVQSQVGQSNQILTLAVLDVSPNADDNHRLTATRQRSVHIMEDPYGNHVFHSGRHGKTLMWKAYREGVDEDEERDEDAVDFIIKFTDRPGLADAWDEDSREMRVMSLLPPDFICGHGVLYDMDFDDASGRLVLYMEDGTIFVCEFI